MTRGRHAQLSLLAGLIRDRELARLGRLARARQDMAARIAKLSTRVEISDDPALNAARLAHARWAEQQRIRLNQTLASQSAAVAEQKPRAARALGRTLALQKLAARKP